MFLTRSTGWLLAAAMVPLMVPLTPALAADAPNTGFAGLPGAVTITEPIAIDLSLARNSRDLAALAPLMVARRTPGTGDSLGLTLRGVGDVHTLVDGIDVGANNYFGLFDIDFVRTDAGPQGRLGGPNAAGGIVDVELARPADKVGGYFGVGWGSYGTWDLRGSFDMPVSDVFGVKVSGYKQFDKGYVRDRVTGERLGRDELSGLRFAARLAPTGNITWNVAVAYMAAEGSNILNSRCTPLGEACSKRYAATGMQRQKRLGGAPQYALAGPTGEETPVVSGRKASFPLGSKRETVLFTSDLFLGSDTLNLQLLTGYLDGRQKGAMDFANGEVFPNPALLPAAPTLGNANGGLARLFDNHEKRFSQEVRLSGDLVILRYYAGAYFSNVRENLDEAGWQTMTDAVPEAGGLVAGGPVQTGFFDAQPFHKRTSASGYAGFSFDPTWNLTFSASLRYTRIKETLAEACDSVLCGSGLYRGRAKWGAWTPGAALKWRPGGEWLLYASATRGFMAPEVAPAPGESVVERGVGWTYELGAKRNFGPVAVALSGFHTRYNHSFVGSTPLVALGAADGPLETGTVGDFRNTGAELRIEAAPMAHSRVWLAAGVQGAKWKNVTRAGYDACVGAGGGVQCLTGVIGPDGQVAKPTYAPDWTLQAGVSHAFAIPYAGIFLEPVVDVAYRSAMTLDPAGALGEAGGRFLVNAALAIRTDDSNWLLRIECQNCFNKDYFESEAYGFRYLGMPRTWMLKALRTF